MLTSIREKTQGWIAGIILGLIAIPFALWGINYYFEGGPLKVAVVNGTDITVDTYRRTLEDQRRSFQQILGRGADPRLLDSPAFRESVMNGLIDEILVTADVEAAGYRISDADLSRQIRTSPQFQRDGRFDPQLYETLLRGAGLNPRGFEQRLRHDVQMRQAESGYAESAMVSSQDLSTLLRLQAQEREAVVATLRPASLRSKVKVSAAEVEQEYQAHPERYQTPERVRVELLQLSAGDLAREVRVSEEELRQAESEARQAMAGKEERRSSHILVKLAAGADAAAEKAAMAKIQGLRAKLAAGADFASLAKQNSEDPGSAAQGGDLGFIGRGSLDKEFEKALFSLGKTGALSAPVRSTYGLHLIKLTGVKTPAHPAVSRAKLESELKARKAEQRFFDLSERFRNLVYEQSDSLKPAAETLGLRIETSDWFTRNGSGAGLAGNAKAIEAAFDPEVLEQGRNSAVLETGPSVLVALRLAGHEPARTRSLGEVRAEIEKTLLAAAAQAEADRLGGELLGKLQAGESLEALTRQYGLELSAARVYTRKSPGTDPQLLTTLFKAAHPEGGKPAVGEARLADGTVAVFAVRRVIEPAKLATDSAEATALRRTLEARRGKEYYDQHRAGLRQQASITLYKDQM